MAEELTLHSSWRGIIASFVGGAFPLAIGFTVAGAAVLLGLAIDYPIASTFDQAGVTRRALARRQRLDWGRVRQLSRTRSRGLRKSGGGLPGGLVAVVGRRRYLLVDQPEGGVEYDDLERLLGDQGSRLEIDLVMRPNNDAASTWLYRRRRWRPET